MRLSTPQEHARARRLFFWAALVLSALTACATGERLIYNRDDVRIGVETDPSVTRAKTPVANAQPAQLTPEDIKTSTHRYNSICLVQTILHVTVPPQDEPEPAVQP